MRVLRDPDRLYSMCGPDGADEAVVRRDLPRHGRGPGLPGKVEDQRVSFRDRRGARLSRSRAGAALNALAVAYAVKELVKVPECKIDLRRHLITPALAGGLPSLVRHSRRAAAREPRRRRIIVDPWGWSWEPAETRKPRCPGDYMATSRYCFYPDPIPRVQAFGKSHGQALRKAVRAYFDTLRKPGQPGGFSPARSAGSHGGGLPFGGHGQSQGRGRGWLVYPDNDELARNVIGVMTGFLPPADGCMRWALYEWIEDKTLPRVQHDLTSCPSERRLRAGGPGAATLAGARDAEAARARPAVAHGDPRPSARRRRGRRRGPGLHRHRLGAGRGCGGRDHRSPSRCSAATAAGRPEFAPARLSGPQGGDGDDARHPQRTVRQLQDRAAAGDDAGRSSAIRVPALDARLSRPQIMPNGQAIRDAKLPPPPSAAPTAISQAGDGTISRPRRSRARTGRSRARTPPSRRSPATSLALVPGHAERGEALAAPRPAPCARARGRRRRTPARLRKAA